jgi:hypothetical protein
MLPVHVIPPASGATVNCSTTSGGRTDGTVSSDRPLSPVSPVNPVSAVNPAGTGRKLRGGAIGVGLLFAAALLAGCGGSDDASAQAAATASAIASAVGVAPVGTEEPASTSGPVTGEEFCAVLKKAQSELDSLPSEEVAFVNLTLELVKLWEENGALTAMDAATMDALATSCPEVAAAALKVTGKESFVDFR